MTLGPGESSGCATIRIVADDVIEGPETFTVTISTDAPFAVISSSSAVLTITGELGKEEEDKMVAQREK